MRGSQKGFSLPELAVGLGVTALVGLTVWGLWPQARQAGSGQADVRALAQAEAAVEGFMQRNHRLPCPDTNADGRENCGVTTGQLPWADLGLSAREAVLRYGVNGVALTAPGTGHIPKLPVLAPAGYTAPTLSGGGAYSPFTFSNGLDFCTRLREAVSAGNGLSAAGVPVGYVLAHPGANGRFDGDNITGFALPDTPHTPTYDDRVSGAGLAELSGRLTCPQRLGDAHAAARSAYTAHDLDRVADQFLQFRSFALQIRITNVNYSAVNFALANVDLLNAIATSATAIAVAANSAGGTAGSIVGGVIAVGAATAALGAATYSMAQAIIARTKAEEQLAGAVVVRAQVAADWLQAYQQAVATDMKGLRP